MDPAVWDALIAINGRMENQYADQLLQREAKLNILQSQINPHFLYNTLDAIRSEILDIGLERPAEMLHELASFFRYSISEKNPVITLREEFQNVDTYINIMRYRFDNRFMIKTILDETDAGLMDLRMPKMVLQPLIENAISHGLEPIRGDGQIVLQAVRTDRFVEIVVQDNGAGINAERLAQIRRQIQSGETQLQRSRHGLALVNVNKRLQLYFGPTSGLTINSAEGMGTEIHIRMPVAGAQPANTPDAHLDIS